MNVTSNDENKLGGSFTFPGTALTAHRMGYGAMQLADRGAIDRKEQHNESST